MALRDPKKNDFGAERKIVDFSRGLYTLRPHERIPDNASPYSKNAIWDNAYTLQKIWGTSALLSVAQYITGAVYNLYNYVLLDGMERLIIQGVATSDSKMSLFALDPISSPPGSTSPTRILGANDELVNKRRCCFCTWKGRLYVVNGVDPMRYWDGSSWKTYHANKDERFKYIKAYRQRLWMAGSSKNPSRVIYSDKNECSFNTYYNGGTQYIDFTSQRGYSPIMWLEPFEGGLLVFKTDSIFELHGDPDDGINFNEIATVGTVSGWSVQVQNDKVHFAAKDGHWMIGKSGIKASPEDQALQTQPRAIRVSSEIDDFWSTYFTLPDPYATGEKVWSGSTDLGTFTFTSSVTGESVPSVNTPPITDNPVVVNAGFASATHTAVSSQTTVTNWVDLSSGLGANVWFSQTDHLNSASSEVSIPSIVSLRLRSQGTIGTSHQLHVYVCKGKNSDTEPDFDKVYAEGELTGAYITGVDQLDFDTGTVAPTVGATVNGQTSGATGVVNRIVLTSGSWSGGNAAGTIYITSKTGTWQNDENIRVATAVKAVTNTAGDSSPITTACDVLVPMTYWDYPQNLYDGLPEQDIIYFIVVKPVGDTTSNYLQWGYNSVDAYTNGRMYNSNTGVPASQSACDYAFKLYCQSWATSGNCESGTWDTNTLSINHWGRIYIHADTSTVGGYTRNMTINKIRYQFKAADSGWTLDADGTLIENGGMMTATAARYLRVKVYFTRPTGSAIEKQDSFTLLSVRVTYYEEAPATMLVASAIHEDRYILSMPTVTDPETPPS